MDTAHRSGETDAHLTALLQRVAAGDRAAFSGFYDDSVARVLRVIQRTTVDRSLAEEVAQEVFLEIWTTAARFDPGRGSAAGWVLTIARRRAIDRVRSHQSSRSRDLRIGRRDIPLDFDCVADTAETRFEHGRVVEAMRRITGVQRQVLALSYVEGYSAAEIAQILDLPVTTVRTRARSGLVRLRELLEA